MTIEVDMELLEHSVNADNYQVLTFVEEQVCEIEMVLADVDTYGIRCLEADNVDFTERKQDETF